jgi:hypothetical protein
MGRLVPEAEKSDPICSICVVDAASRMALFELATCKLGKQLSFFDRPLTSGVGSTVWAASPPMRPPRLPPPRFGLHGRIPIEIVELEARQIDHGPVDPALYGARQLVRQVLDAYFATSQMPLSAPATL